ncbi:hypothetical protein [Cognatilysobacter bugurensis]|uniref:Uncharacterized protein n=1 Tax=Cognatilysobacter bugurensis TaxID=543356 RepID=A0A918T240_9GAMM|nr:hypothetical protein [Lysobacter bugurensis]GHA83328.1 hypothetical protein GCM10007067_21800 [Lysobacter bugurensis]
MTSGFGWAGDWRSSGWRKLMWGGAAAFLAWPLIAMQFGVPGVNWTASDFIVMGVLLGAAGGAVELGARMSPHPAYRAGAAVAIGGAFLIVWINLAVGAIGSEDNPANLMYAGVLLTGLVGAALARLRARGLVRTLLAMAAVQVLVPFVAVMRGLVEPATSLTELAGVTLFFLAPWLLSAALFALAARAEAAPRGVQGSGG